MDIASTGSRKWSIRSRAFGAGLGLAAFALSLAYAPDAHAQRYGVYGPGPGYGPRRAVYVEERREPFYATVFGIDGTTSCRCFASRLRRLCSSIARSYGPYVHSLMRYRRFS